MQINEETSLRCNALIIWQGSLSAVMNITYLQMFFRKRAGVGAIQNITKLKKLIWFAKPSCYQAHVCTFLLIWNQ